jgi:hypothetical protein
MAIVNTRLLSHPLNYIIILMMLVIAGLFGHLLLKLLNQDPASASTKNLPSGYSTQG